MKMSILIGFLCLFLSLKNFAFQNELPHGVTKIEELDSSAPTSDLSRLDRNLKRAKIFAIGESAHGVKDYAKFQFRLIKYAIEKFGYRRIFVETLTDPRELNKYVKTGKGNLKEILYNNPWYDHNDERIEMYQWISSYNLKHPEKMVRVDSVDPQKPWVEMPIISNFLLNYSTDFYGQYAEVMKQNCFGAKFKHQVEWAFSQEYQDYFSTGKFPEGTHEACTDSIHAVQSIVEKNKRSIQNQFGVVGWGNVKDALRSLLAWQLKSFHMFFDFPLSMDIRENAFAKSVEWKWKRNNPNHDPVILIAHNLHIAKRNLKAAFTNDPWDGFRPVGARLLKTFNRQYVAIAQSGHEIAGMFGSGFPVLETENSLDYYLSQFGKEILMVKMNAGWLKKKNDWVLQEEHLPNGRHYKMYRKGICNPSSFDYLVFHKSSVGSTWNGKPSP